MMMDHYRHHGAPRRWLPRVTVEEVDDAGLPDMDLRLDDTRADGDDESLDDAGATAAD
jgi:hypothetical protein